MKHSSKAKRLAYNQEREVERQIDALFAGTDQQLKEKMISEGVDWEQDGDSLILANRLAGTISLSAYQLSSLGGIETVADYLRLLANQLEGSAREVSADGS
jgi:hypothetical protein